MTTSRSYLAAWPDRETEDRLKAAGLTRRVHLTTFFDGRNQLHQLTPYPWQGPQTAIVDEVVEWGSGSHSLLIAVMRDCSWSKAISDHFAAQGSVQDKPHRAHVTLDKRVPAGTAAKFQNLVGMLMRFDRHGDQSLSPGKFMATPLPA